MTIPKNKPQNLGILLTTDMMIHASENIHVCFLNHPPIATAATLSLPLQKFSLLLFTQPTTSSSSSLLSLSLSLSPRARASHSHLHVFTYLPTRRIA